MKTGVLDSRLEFHELPFYEVEGLCQNIVDTAITKSEEYRAKYEEYKKNITRFSPAFEFCIHELGWMLYDPFCVGNEEVLFSNGERCYIASLNFVHQPGFDRHSITKDDVGYPRLEDRVVGYDPNLLITNIKEGIVDQKGYVDCGFVDSLDTLAEIEVMENNIKDKEAYLDYMRSKDKYSTKLEYITSKENVISAKRMPDGNISLQYVSENTGKVNEFIERLKNQDMLGEYIPIKANENTDLIKAV